MVVGCGGGSALSKQLVNGGMDVVDEFIAFISRDSPNDSMLAV
jgi:hypothetical protein